MQDVEAQKECSSQEKNQEQQVEFLGEEHNVHEQEGYQGKGNRDDEMNQPFMLEKTSLGEMFG